MAEGVVFLHEIVPTLEGGRFRHLQPKYFAEATPVHIWEVDAAGYAALLARADPGDVLLLGVLVRDHLAPVSGVSRPAMLERAKVRPATVALRGTTFRRVCNITPRGKLTPAQFLDKQVAMFGPETNMIISWNPQGPSSAHTQALLVHCAKYPATRFVVELSNKVCKADDAATIAVYMSIPAVVFLRVHFHVSQAFSHAPADPAFQTRLIWIGDVVLAMVDLWAPAAKKVFGPQADLQAIAAAHAEFYAACK